MTMTSLHQIFRKLHDPRINRRKRHKLLDIIILSILAVLCGAESYDSIELFGKTIFGFSQTTSYIVKRHSLARHNKSSVFNIESARF
jgi:hypothetical protein